MNQFPKLRFNAQIILADDVQIPEKVEEFLKQTVDLILCLVEDGKDNPEGLNELTQALARVCERQALRMQSLN